MCLTTRALITALRKLLPSLCPARRLADRPLPKVELRGLRTWPPPDTIPPARRAAVSAWAIAGRDRSSPRDLIRPGRIRISPSSRFTILPAMRVWPAENRRFRPVCTSRSFRAPRKASQKSLVKQGADRAKGAPHIAALYPALPPSPSGQLAYSCASLRDCSPRRAVMHKPSSLRIPPGNRREECCRGARWRCIDRVGRGTRSDRTARYEE